MKSARFWTAAKLKDAIERCNAETEAMIARHARPEAIEARRRGIEHLHILLENAEAAERAEANDGQS